MTEIEPTYIHESVDAWENSSLDARFHSHSRTADFPLQVEAISDVIEASYHAVSAGDVDAGATLLYKYAYEGPKARLTMVLGNYEVALNALLQFYPFRDLSLEPRTTSPDSRRWIMHETAVCQHVLGQLGQSAAMANRAARAALAAADEHNAAITYHNLAETYLANGALNSSREAADTALDLAIKCGNQEDALVANTIIGRLGDLLLLSDVAESAYSQALQIAVDATRFPILYSLSGLRYAEHLLMSRRTEEALRVSQENLAFCADQGWQADVASSLAQLTTMPSHTSQLTPEELEERSVDAIDLARSIGHNVVLTDTLLARARLKNYQQAPRDAHLAASEALTIAQTHNLRIAEVDSRILLAAAYAALNDSVNAHAEANLADELARQLGYTLGYTLIEDQRAAAGDEQS